MLTVQFSGTVILSGVAFVVLLGCFLFGKQVPLLPVIILAGVLGAFFSALMRLVDKAGAALITSTAQNLRGRYLLMYSLIPPVIGAIAAVVLYLVFVGKFFESPFFPKIGCLPNQTCTSLLDLMKYYWPVESGGLRQGAGLVVHRRILRTAGTRCSAESGGEG